MKILKTSNDKLFNCPKCNHKSLHCKDHICSSYNDIIWHDKFICDNCGCILLSEPSSNKAVRFVDDIESSSSETSEFDSKWEETFGPDSIRVMSVNDFNKFMDEVESFE